VALIHVLLSHIVKFSPELNHRAAISGVEPNDSEPKSSVFLHQPLPAFTKLLLQALKEKP